MSPIIQSLITDANYVIMDRHTNYSTEEFAQSIINFLTDLEPLLYMMGNDDIYWEDFEKFNKLLGL